MSPLTRLSRYIDVGQQLLLSGGELFALLRFEFVLGLKPIVNCGAIRATAIFIDRVRAASDLFVSLICVQRWGDCGGHLGLVRHFFSLLFFSTHGSILVLCWFVCRNALRADGDGNEK